MLCALVGRQAADDARSARPGAGALQPAASSTAALAARRKRADPRRAPTAPILIAARAHLERFRESAAPKTSTTRATSCAASTPAVSPRERVEFVIGLGETLYFDDRYRRGGELFDTVLEPARLSPAARERVIDWWASALDPDARPRPDFERQAIYQRIRDRMRLELGANPASGRRPIGLRPPPAARAICRRRGTRLWRRGSSRPRDAGQRFGETSID